MRVIRRLATNRLAALGAICCVVVILIAICAPSIAPHDPYRPNIRDQFSPPFSEGHLLGTDDLGRDVLSRIIYGSRVSLMVAALTVGGATLLGGTAGVLSGYFGGRVDGIIMRVVDVFCAIPTILIAISVVGLFGRSVGNLIFALAVSYAPGFGRLCYSVVVATREHLYVEASRALGASSWRILRQDILPNIFPLVVVQMTFDLSRTIMAEAGLGFLGIGVQPPTPSWGGMLADARIYIFQSVTNTILPGVAILIAVFSFNLLGDGLRDLLDPRAWQAGE